LNDPGIRGAHKIIYSQNDFFVYFLIVLSLIVLSILFLSTKSFGDKIIEIQISREISLRRKARKEEN